MRHRGAAARQVSPPKGDDSRRRGFDGGLTMLSDGTTRRRGTRRNLSKDYLAGTAGEEWIPLKGPEFYAENQIDLQLNTTITRIDVAGRQVVTENGRSYPFDRLLVATGAEPVRSPSRAPTSPMSSRCASSPTAGPSSSAQRTQKRPSCLARAS